MSTTAFLLFRRGTSLWAVPGEQVGGLEAQGDTVCVRLATTGLWADEVVGLARGLEVRPVGALLRRFWRVRCRGVAVHDGVPLVVVDAENPPRALTE